MHNLAFMSFLLSTLFLINPYIIIIHVKMPRLYDTSGPITKHFSFLSAHKLPLITHHSQDSIPHGVTFLWCAILIINNAFSIWFSNSNFCLKMSVIIFTLEPPSCNIRGILQFLAHNKIIDISSSIFCGHKMCLRDFPHVLVFHVDCFWYIYFYFYFFPFAVGGYLQ